VVCQCANVTCGALRRAVASGHATPDSLARATSASTLCGSCKPLLSVLCGQAPVATARSYGLPTAAGAALVVAGVTLVVPRIPVAQSVERQGLDVLWIDSNWKQTTGFGLIALVAIGLLLSARKRLRWFRIGAYPLWRTFHGVLGALGLVALFVHTGFRLGSNLNLALMLALLASAITGATAGLLAVLAPRTDANGLAQRFGRMTRTLHDYAFWPVPILVAFHVFKVYYY
jgi:nitrite reductase (NADH) large subunit